MKAISLFGVNFTLESFKTLPTLSLTADKGMTIFWTVAFYYDSIIKYKIWSSYRTIVSHMYNYSEGVNMPTNQSSNHTDLWGQN